MWGHIYVESNDAIVLHIVSLGFAMHHVDLILYGPIMGGGAGACYH